MIGAIFSVTVPATIMRSHCRGEPRKTSAPKRAMSWRLSTTAIISIAQQARPNCIGQSEFLRPQSDDGVDGRREDVVRERVLDQAHERAPRRHA